MILEIKNLKNGNALAKTNNTIIIYQNKNDFDKYEYIVVLDMKFKEIIANEYYTYDNNGRLINFKNNSFGYDFLLSESYNTNNDIIKDEKTYEDYIKYIKDNITIDMIFEQIFEI